MESAINATTARVTFNKAVPSGVDFTNFDIDGGLTITNVEFSSDRKTATITSSSDFTRNQEYKVSVFGVKDAEGNEYPEVTGAFTWEVAEGVTVALEASTLDQGQTVGLTVKDEAGKDVKDAVVEIESYNTNIVGVSGSGSAPSNVKVTAKNLAGTADVVVKTTLPDGSVLSNTFKVTVKEAVTTISNAGYTLKAASALGLAEANTVAFKEFGSAKTSLVEGSSTVQLIAFGETNGNPDTANIDFEEVTRVVSSNPVVATAVLNDSDIDVTPLRQGSTTITVTMKDGSRKTFPITVTAQPELKTIGVDATTISLSDENRSDSSNLTFHEGVDGATFKVTALDQFNKEIGFGTTGKVTVSSSTDGIKLYQDGVTADNLTTVTQGDQLVAGDNTIEFDGSEAEVHVVASKDTPVRNARVTVNYFAKTTDTQPTATKTITVNVADVDPTVSTSAIDVVTVSEIDANAQNVKGVESEFDFSATEVYALDSKGNRLELLTDATVAGKAPTATIATENASDKFVAVTDDTVGFKNVNHALTYLRSANTVNVEVVADGVKKVLPITYKNSAVVPNKATVSTTATSIKLANTVDSISFEDLIFGQADFEQLILDNALDAASDTESHIIGTLKNAKNGGYKYNKPLVSILGTDGKSLATGINVYGGAVTEFTANTWNNAVVNELKGLDTPATFTTDEFEVEFMVANVNDSSTITDGTNPLANLSAVDLSSEVKPVTGKATTFTLVVTGIYTKDSVVNIEGGAPTTAQKAAHNLLAAPAQLNVSVSAE
ncbi:hypothetical protein PQ478_19715 [Alkalihalophilus pseudofirmus]|uniref:hypothetical protein n=1 Tax=Alkalihalophilus pseudofirmus TaxID=79885 RepID=UPI00259B1F09|nr:hypothetical protein [Alkalihalophilus pseudofirmus]WEG16707.1 hypothetical protein PQ478_19715 [Alkalihalophilus pseudofirmus]